jgi:pilin isopeptide linkage protein
MRKFKKLLTALLSTAMITSMAVLPAMATDDNTASGSGSTGTNTEAAEKAGDTDSEGDTDSKEIKTVTFDKYYISEKGSVLPDETFTFTMVPATVSQVNNAAPKTADGLEIVSGNALKTSTVTLTFNSANKDIVKTTTDDGKYAEKLTGTFSLEGINWGTEPKVYRYTVSEVAGQNKNITYSTDTYTVDVYTNNEGKAVYALCGEIDTATQQMKTDESTKKLLKFENTSSVDVLEIKKTVTGSLGSKTTQFDFTLDIPVEGDNIELKAGDTFTGTFTRASGSSKADDTQITIKVGTPAKFTLADGESLKIEGVPEGMIYIVEEDATTSADYKTSIVGTTTQVINGQDTTVTAKVPDGKKFDAHKTAQNMQIVDGGNTVEFTNDKDNTPTGLVLEYAPYLMGMLIVVIGAVLALVSRKRRTAR